MTRTSGGEVLLELEGGRGSLLVRPAGDGVELELVLPRAGRDVAAGIVTRSDGQPVLVAGNVDVVAWVRVGRGQLLELVAALELVAYPPSGRAP